MFPLYVTTFYWYMLAQVLKIKTWVCLWFLHLMRFWQVRPTSETIVNHMFTQWIHSHRDLPLMINQVQLITWLLVTIFVQVYVHLSETPVICNIVVGKCHKMGDAHETIYQDSGISVAGRTYGSCHSRRSRKRGSYLYHSKELMFDFRCPSFFSDRVLLLLIAGIADDWCLYKICLWASCSTCYYRSKIKGGDICWCWEDLYDWSYDGWS